MAPAPPTRKKPPSSLPGPASRLDVTTVAQFVKFGIVGVSNTLLSFAVYTLLLKGFGVWYVAASGIGFSVGAVNGFLLNRRWTFKEHVGDALTPVRWGIVQGCGLGVNEGLLYLFVHDASLDKLLAHWGASMAKDFLMVINVDGVERREPFYEAHFVECGPGEHGVAIHPSLPSGTPLQPVFWASKTIQVTVPAGEVVHLTYTLGGVGQVTLELGQGDAIA